MITINNPTNKLLLESARLLSSGASAYAAIKSGRIKAQSLQGHAANSLLQKSLTELEQQQLLNQQKRELLDSLGKSRVKSALRGVNTDSLNEIAQALEQENIANRKASLSKRKAALKSLGLDLDSQRQQHLAQLEQLAGLLKSSSLISNALGRIKS